MRKLFYVSLIALLGIGWLCLDSWKTPSVHLEVERVGNDELSNGSVLLTAKVTDNWTETVHGQNLAGKKVTFYTNGFEKNSAFTNADGFAEVEFTFPEGNHALQAKFLDGGGTLRRSNAVGLKVSSSPVDKLFSSEVGGGLSLGTVCWGAFVVLLVCGALGLFFSWSSAEGEAERARLQVRQTQRALVTERTARIQDLQTVTAASLAIAREMGQGLVQQGPAIAGAVSREVSREVSQAMSEVGRTAIMSSTMTTSRALDALTKANRQLAETSKLLAEGRDKPPILIEGKIVDDGDWED